MSDIFVTCPLCREKIDRIDVKYNGKLAWGFCPICHGEMTEKQVKDLNAEYERLLRSA